MVLKGRIGRVVRIASLVGAVGCGDVVNQNDAGGAVGRDSGISDSSMSHVGECTSQRAVYLVGGNGGLAWFTQVWPVPAVITGFMTTYAFDNPALVANVTGPGPGAHPLYARKIGARSVWQGRGSAPAPSVFVGGNNETHTSAPTSIVGTLLAAGASLQTDLHPVVAALAISGAEGTYRTITGAPPLVTAASANAALHVFDGKLTPNQMVQLAPNTEQLGRYVPAGSVASEVEFGTSLALTANAFKLGLAGTVIIPAFLDDPHDAFDNGVAGVTARANRLAVVLDMFYTDLAAATEPSCGHAGKPMSLADNVVMAVFGDTPKSPFVAAGWSDQSPSSTNWIYVRSNGFTKPGWFGSIQQIGTPFFDPVTGLAGSGSYTADAAAAYAATLYAITRGNAAAVAAITAAPYSGLVLN